MKKALAVAGILALSITPTASFADHLNMGVGDQFIELMLSGDLSHRDLEGVPLDTYYRLGYFTPSGANLSNTNLKDADLEGLNLFNANFSSANLYNTNLKKADLRGANLNGVNLISAYVTRVFQ